MLLAEYDIELPPPLLVVLAEMAVGVAAGVRLPVLHPEELQGQVPVFPKLFVDRRKLRHRSWRRRRGRVLAVSEQSVFDPVVIPVLCQGPAKPGGLGPPEVIVNRGLTDGTTPGDLALPEP